MIGVFENMVRLNPQRTCFSYVDKDGNIEALSYRETRMIAAGLASLLRRRGVALGDAVAVDLPNQPACVFLLLAAAYGGFTLVTLNNRLTDAEKQARLLDLQRSRAFNVAYTVDESNVANLIRTVANDATGTAEAAGPGHAQRTSFYARTNIATAEARSTRALGRAGRSRGAAARRREDEARQDALESVIHFAERGAHVFDRGATAVVMFTSGTTGRSKAVPLTWENLCGSAAVSNASLNRHGEGLWQIALPLYHVGGLQMVVRSLLNANPFILYQRFDAERVLADAARRGATHISVVDKMLQDMLASSHASGVGRYECILLGGGPLNAQTLGRALAMRARVYASYGMTETASQIANSLVTPGFTGGMSLLEGYEARIVDAGPDGFGRLAVRGPGLFGGYLNARAAYTADGFFLTGDTAAIAPDGKLYVKERTDDMFISGGENVYPAEIREKLLRVPGVADAYIFGAPDDTWGRRPVGFIERGGAAAPAAGGPAGIAAGVAGQRARTLSDRRFAQEVAQVAAPQLSRMYQPKHLFALPRFPRTGIGKVDRAALRRLYEQRIEIKRVNLYRIRLPFRKPFATAKGTLSFRESLLVEVVDHAGRTGLGECVSFPTDWYLPEVLDQDIRILREQLIPLVLNTVLLHPSEADGLFAACPGANELPMGRGALEPALWDLYGKIVEQPLWQLIGGQAPEGTDAVAVPAGAAIPVGPVAETVAAAQRCVHAGYTRVKLKVTPGTAYFSAQAVRKAFPELVISLDANQSFTEHDIEELRNLDELDIAWIEEPLDPRRPVASGPHDLFARLAQLQRRIKTPVCLDESIVSARDLARVLKHPELKCFALKIGKFGGIEPALQFVHMAQARGMRVWMGGMYDTGVSRRMHAAFETLSGVSDAGDIGATSRYFDTDVTNPPYTVERGQVTLTRRGHEFGLGCELDRAALSHVLIDQESFE
ncbi:o-succinylbenzoate synthase [uncultured Senegalimassilia sp.]|uniref:o-succinylbenzoate synthase n=1 Tax=uncultured Senegalimassilia sp. TaxID=1714350 RepID=UPI0026E00AA1|nr:o-succinylbenzoate synthase [uncultured Senegalimassilia sp.]